MGNDLTWSNPGTRAAPAVSLSAAYRAAPSGGVITGGSAALGFSADSAAHGTDATFTTDGSVSFVTDVSGLSALWLGDDLRLDGVAKTFMLDRSDGAAIDNTNGVFNDKGPGNLLVKRTGLRHSRVASVIHAFCDKSQGHDYRCYLADPLGSMGGNVATAGRYYWLSFRTRLIGDTSYLRGHSYSSLTGSFGTTSDGGLGEQVTLTLSDATTETAYIQAVDSVNKIVWFYWPSTTSRTLLQGGTMAGASGSLTFASGVVTYYVGNPKDFRMTCHAQPSGVGSDTLVSSGAIFTTTPGKQLRLYKPDAPVGGPDTNGNNYDGPNGLGNLYWSSSPDRVSESVKRTPDPTTGRHYLRQVLFDRQTGYWAEATDGDIQVLQADASWFPADVIGMTFNAVGQEVDGNVCFEGDFGEIFVARTILRIGLSDSPTASGIDFGALEWQILKGVSGNTATVEINRGAFADSATLYFYLFNDFSNTPANSSGIMLPGVA